MNSELSRDSILAILSSKRHEIKSLGVNKIGLFGSAVRREEREESDLDFLVQFEPGMKSFRKFMSLLFFLEETFSREIDLVTVESLSPYIGPKITREVEYATIGPRLCSP